jgi:hypothetical protein
MIRGRANTLWTPERKARCIGRGKNKKCNNCDNNTTGTLGHILNSCTHNFHGMTTRHNDVCKILSQYLKMLKKKLIDITNEKVEKLDNKIGWNTRIKIRYETAENEISEQEEDEAIRCRPDLWFWKTENCIIKKETFPILTLNLVEVTIPFGLADVEFEKANGQIIESSPPNIVNSSLVNARRRKEVKYHKIEEYTKHMINQERDRLKLTYKVADIQVKIWYVVVSSLGIVPKEALNTLKDMFKVQNRAQT